jgi:ribosomal protein S18 acetylase RimI-like enzyme
VDEADTSVLRVTYLELREQPAAPAPRGGAECIVREHLALGEYLALYRNVGESLRWDQRLRMPEEDLAALLEGGSLTIYVLRDGHGHALGFCEFDRHAFPEVELKNFGLIPGAQGRGLGPWLLSVALREEWTTIPTRIWLHTDTWDHPAAIRVYERAGFRVYAVRDEPSGAL